MSYTYCKRLLNFDQSPLSTSLYTTFVVMFDKLPSGSQTTTFKPLLLLTRETVTYSWSCVNTGRGWYIPTFDSDCPWLLFIVIANDTDKGYCFLTIFRGRRLSDGVILSLGMITLCPKCVPLIICA